MAKGADRKASSRAGAAPASRVRIIAGEWRGRWIEFQAADGLRPTGDRVRETLFNWLQPTIVGARCLDLFAGSGALGFEAASRGGASVLMVEENPQTVMQLRRQAERLGAANVEIRAGSALEFVQRDPGEAVFDIAFLDPPFATGLLRRCLDLLADWPGLASNAQCYLEYPQTLPPALPAGWRFRRQGRAGEVGFGLIERLVE